MLFKRGTSVLLTGAMMAAMITGMSTAASADEGEAQQIHFYAWTNEAQMVPMVDAFNEEYAGKYELVYEKIANADTLTINTALSSGEQVDVMSQAGAVDLRDRVDDGIYLGLKQFFDKEGWDYAEVMGESVEETMNIDGDYYAVPYCNNINMVYFNKKMFDEAGVAYPQAGWTWDDFRETAMALTSGEGANKVYGAMIDITGTEGGDNYWDLIARQELGAFTYYNDDYSATQFDAPAFRTSLDYFYNLAMVDQCIVPYDEYTALQYSNDGTAMAGLYNGKFAMWIAPVYGCFFLEPDYGEVPEGTDIGLVDMPTLEGGKTVTTCYTSTVSIPQSCKDPEAAWTALKFICFDRADLFAGVKAMNPGYLLKTDEEKEEFYDVIFRNRPGLDYDMAMSTMALDRTLVSKDCTISAGQTQINDLVNQVMSLVFTGEMGTDEALEKLKTDGDTAIAAVR